MKLIGTQVLALAFGVQAALVGAAAAQTHPTDDDALAATLSAAWNTAVDERATTAPLLTADQKLKADAGYAVLAAPPPGSAVLAAVDASAVTDTGVAADAVARVATPTTYEQLKAVGKANERAAYRRKREAGRYDPPLKDEKGYYFDVVQTWNYRHAPRTDEVGLQPPEYYAAMRCRAAPRSVGPLADNPNWKRSVFWRVCPDETGRYRPAM